MKIIDLHTHLPAPRLDAVISVAPDELPPEGAFPGQFYSVGYHPWQIKAMGLSPEQVAALREVAGRRDVVAIGEAGIDLAREGCAPLFAQMLAFKAQIEVSEALGLPMILHCVKAHDIIIGLRKEYAPKQRWVVHGFRGKPTVLAMLLEAGIDVSYGEKFNPESVAATPIDRLFAETDDSQFTIEETIEKIKGANPGISAEIISQNIDKFLRL